MNRATAPVRATETKRKTKRAHVDVWCVPLAELAHDPAAFALLSPEEHAQYARLQRESEYWAASRAALRRLLARALGVTPRDVHFGLSARGKPELAPEHASDLRFGVARSGAIALIALRSGAEVGVDVERVRAGVDAEGIVAAAFPARERASWLASSRTSEDFFTAWVRHEALAKATGLGIAGLTGTALPAGYTARALPTLPGFAAAVASEGEGWTLACRTPAWCRTDAAATWPRA